MSSARGIPKRIEDRLIVALDVPSIAEARTLVAKLDGIVSFFKIGYWLQFAAGIDGLFDYLIKENKKIFLDTKMFDIGETVKQGIARIAERGISFVTVHSDGDVIHAAAEGKGHSNLKILVVPVLTSRDTDSLRELGYYGGVAELIGERARAAVACGCDGVIAAPRDNPNAIRHAAGSEELLVVTPGVRCPAPRPTITGAPAAPPKRLPRGPTTSSSAGRSLEARILPTPRLRSSTTCAVGYSHPFRYLVIPAKAGTQGSRVLALTLDPRFRGGNDVAVTQI